MLSLSTGRGAANAVWLFTICDGKNKHCQQIVKNYAYSIMRKLWHCLDAWNLFTLIFELKWNLIDRTDLDNLDYFTHITFILLSASKITAKDQLKKKQKLKKAKKFDEMTNEITFIILTVVLTIIFINWSKHLFTLKILNYFLNW